jgi:ABC-type dipeptide/oligopeptide/nickel transport system permease subunit
VQLSFPVILLAISVVAVVGRSLPALVAVLGVNLLGDGLRDVLDPQLQDY